MNQTVSFSVIVKSMCVIEQGGGVVSACALLLVESGHLLCQCVVACRQHLLQTLATLRRCSNDTKVCPGMLWSAHTLIP